MFTFGEITFTFGEITFTFGEITFTFGEIMFTFWERRFTLGDSRRFRVFGISFVLLGGGGFETLWVGGSCRGFRTYKQVM